MAISLRTLVVVAACAVGLIVPAAASADQSYTDPEGDAAGAPDVTTVEVSNDNAGNVNFRFSLAGNQELATDSALVLMIDTDRTSTTGGREGEEVTIILDGSDGSFDYGRWNGTKIDYAIQGQTVRIGSRAGLIEVLVNKSELNNAATFDFWAYGDKFLADALVGQDSAPDGSTVWGYALVTKEVALRAARVSATPGFPVPGKPFRVQFSAFQVSNSAVVIAGVTQCAARIGTNVLKTRARFIGSVARCEIVIPKGTSGKTLRGTIGISIPGGRIAKAFSFRIL